MMVDPADHAVLWFWFDDFGFAPLPPGRGVWGSGRLSVERRTVRGVGRTSWTLDGDRLVQEVSIKAPDDDVFTVVSTMTLQRQTSAT